MRKRIVRNSGQWATPCVTTLLTLTAPAASQQPDILTCRASSDATPDVGAYSLFVDAGRHFCVAPTPDGDDTLVPCLRIGEVHVGQAQADVEAVLGDPWQSVSDDGSALAYLVFRDTVTHQAAYYVVTYERFEGDQIAAVVQFTGDRPEGLFQFSCLDLGSDSTAVLRQLGEPADREPVEIEVENLEGEVWYYDPTPLSLEIVDGKVYSVRVWRPDGVPPRRRELTLLKSRRSPQAP